jgi:hypothetical protein
MRRPTFQSGQQIGICILCLAAAAIAGRGDNSAGSISGITIDDTGMPVSGVRVNARVLDETPTLAAIKYVQTDEQGRFLIDRLPWGRYKVFTRKDSDGYAYTASTFYSNGLAPEVKVLSKEPNVQVTINLGPKAGKIKGTVTNASTGAPIAAAVRLWRVDHPAYWLEKTLKPEYELLVPSSVSIGIEVSAEGYETWSYAESSSLAQGSLTVRPGEAARLDIKLIPKNNLP